MNAITNHRVYEVLARKSQSGDSKALEELILTFNPVLSSKIFYHTRDKDSLKDLCQECWYAIIDNIQTVKFQVGFEAWALNIARNKAIDWIRLQQKNRERERTAADIEESVDVETPELSKQKQIRQLRISIALLPDAQRIVLDLFYKENLSINEIAEVLNISAGTVKSRLFHAREHLKEIISKPKQ